MSGALLQAQKEGNGDITTISQELPYFTRIDVSLNTDIIINCDTSSFLKITVDQNLLADIEMSVRKNTLVLDQKEWINPSSQVKIYIGAPDLINIEQSTHQTTTILNIDKEVFSAYAEVGEIVLKGNATRLNASVETGDILAEGLAVSTVHVEGRSWGKIKLGSAEKITGSIKDNGRLSYQNDDAKIEVRTDENGKISLDNEKENKPNVDAKYIDIKLKNNSLTFINAYVIGPKPNGRFFSYGFNLFPGQVKEERWTVGTKIYRETKRGARQLLREIAGSDEDQLVKICK
jgi:hypothetical protein